MSMFQCFKDNMFKVAVGELQDILKIDKTNLLVTVQPGVTIGLLNRYLDSFDSSHPTTQYCCPSDGLKLIPK